MKVVNFYMQSLTWYRKRVQSAIFFSSVKIAQCYILFKGINDPKLFLLRIIFSEKYRQKLMDYPFKCRLVITNNSLVSTEVLATKSCKLGNISISLFCKHLLQKKQLFFKKFCCTVDAITLKRTATIIQAAEYIC